MESTTIEERLATLEAKLRRRTALLLTLAVLFPLVLSALVMRWTEKKNVGTSYLVTGEDDVIYGMAQVGGEPKAVDVTFSTYGVTDSRVELAASSDGVASVAVRSGTGPDRSGVRLVSTKSGANVAFDAAVLGGSQLVLGIDDKGLVAREVRADGSTGVEKYLLEVVPPTAVAPAAPATP